MSTAAQRIEQKLDQVLAGQRQILARLDALDGKQPAHTAGPSRTDDGTTFLPGTGALGSSSAPVDDTPPVDQQTGLARIHDIRTATRRHPANPQENP